MIIRSPFVGKSTKKLGEAAYYVRKGVQCARVLSPRKENYRPSLAQAMQQRVFKFLKANYDANALSIIVRNFCDAKPKSGRSQTAYNIFYAAALPSLIDQKETIYGLSDDDMVNGRIFLQGMAKMTDGVLGAFPIKEATTSNIVVDENVFNEQLERANALLSSSVVPFTSDDVQIGFVSAAATTSSDSANTLQVNAGSFVTPSISGGKVTLPVPTIKGADAQGGNTIMLVRFAKKTAAGSIDQTYPTYAFDSFAVAGIEPEDDRPEVQ